VQLLGVLLPPLALLLLIQFGRRNNPR